MRNTARFLISNLYDFNPATDAVVLNDFDELDRWILHRSQIVLSRCRQAYERAEFHVVFHTLNNFCAVDLRSLYLDIVKDRLYCEGKTGKKRRAAQTAVYRILDILVHLMAPVLSFTAEEVWGHLPDRERRANNVFFSMIPASDEALVDNKLAERWDRLFKERGEVLKALEEARAKGIIGHSLDAAVILSPENGASSALLYELIHGDQDRAQDVLIVSHGAVAGDGRANGQGEVCSYRSELLDGAITVAKAPGESASAAGNMMRLSARTLIIRTSVRVVRPC